MKKHVSTISVLILLAAIAIGIPASHLFDAHASTISEPQHRTGTTSPLAYKHACANAPAGYANCLALISTQTVKPTFASAKSHIKRMSTGATPAIVANATGSAAPYSPTALHNAYNLPLTASTTQTVAIVDAYDDPNAESDLMTYRSMFGLADCTTDNGCFKKVDETGGTSYPSSNVSWGMEISLDLDMVSAICQNCNIILVEANSTSVNDLGKATNEAAALGANEISLSYAITEFVSEIVYCPMYYSHPGIAVVASSGDTGSGVKFPADCPNVTSVGGTSLSADGTETAWNTSATSAASGGCSALMKIPAWQLSTTTGCSMRAVSDVSAVADPNTGVYIYDTFGESGSLQAGGTSVATPIIAATYALAGGTPDNTSSATIPWTNSANDCLNTVGNTAYSFQTGLGSPNGLSCF